jgi:molecular chaperone GrpE
MNPIFNKSRNSQETPKMSTKHHLDAENENPEAHQHEAENLTAVQPEPVVTQADYEQMKAERDQLLDRLARLQAEFENARKREARERAEYRDYSTGNVVEQFLPVLDHFHLALQAEGSAEQLRSGVELIVKQMEDALRNLGVQPVESVGTQFDPRVHEALGSVETAEVPDQQVLEEIRRGYKIKDRLLRPALVRVAHNNQQKQA